MNVHEMQKLEKLAKNKNNGVYTKNGYLYRVHDNQVRIISGYDEVVYLVFGNFLTRIGSVEGRQKRKKLMLDYKL